MALYWPPPAQRQKKNDTIKFERPILQQPLNPWCQCSSIEGLIILGANTKNFATQKMLKVGLKFFWALTSSVKRA